MRKKDWAGKKHQKEKSMKEDALLNQQATKLKRSIMMKEQGKKN